MSKNAKHPVRRRGRVAAECRHAATVPVAGPSVRHVPAHSRWSFDRARGRLDDTRLFAFLREILGPDGSGKRGQGNHLEAGAGRRDRARVQPGSVRRPRTCRRWGHWPPPTSLTERWRRSRPTSSARTRSTRNDLHPRHPEPATRRCPASTGCPPRGPRLPSRRRRRRGLDHDRPSPRPRPGRCCAATWQRAWRGGLPQPGSASAGHGTRAPAWTTDVGGRHSENPDGRHVCAREEERRPKTPASAYISCPARAG